MDTNTQNLIIQINQLAQQIAILQNVTQLQKPVNQPAQPPSPSAFERYGQASQKYLFSQVGNTIQEQLGSLLIKETAETSGKAVGTAATETAGTSSVASTFASTIAGIGGIAYGGYQLIKNWGTRNPVGGAISGATVGAGAVALGSAVGAGAMAGAWAGPIGMAAGAVIGAAIGFIKAGKHKDQLQRDAVRDALKDNGIIDNNYTIGLADGSRYDIGIDGGPKAEFNNLRPYEVDTSNKLAGDVIGLVNPFVTVLAGGNKKIQTDFTGYFVNAALSNAGDDIEKARANVLAIFSQMKLQPDEVAGGLQQLTQAGALSPQEGAAMLGGLRDLLSPQPYVMKAPAVLN